MSDYKQTRDAAGKVTTQYDKMLRNLGDDDLVKRLRDTPNWMREGFQDWKDNVRTYDLAPFEAADRIEELEAERDAALVNLFECMEEIDAYIQQEYPQDHHLHERYRQRDYAANPARMFLRDRPDALVKARAMLAEADLKRQTATLEGQNDE